METQGKESKPDKDLEDFDNIFNFGNDISGIAKKLKNNEATVEENVQKATSVHLDVLEEVYEKVPEAAKDGILKAIETIQKGNAAAIDSITKKGKSHKSVARVIWEDKIK